MQVAVVGVMSTVITTLGVVVVAVMNNRSERRGAAVSGVGHGDEDAIEQRDQAIMARDAVIADLRHDLRVAEARADRAEAEADRAVQLLNLLGEVTGREDGPASGR